MKMIETEMQFLRFHISRNILYVTRDFHPVMGLPGLARKRLRISVLNGNWFVSADDCSRGSSSLCQSM